MPASHFPTPASRNQDGLQFEEEDNNVAPSDVRRGSYVVASHVRRANNVVAI